MASKNSDQDLLKDTKFDRQVAPKSEKANLLISLLKKNAFDEESAILLSNYPIKPEELDPLINEGRIKLISHSPMHVYLTRLGKIIAQGEASLREREKT